MIGMQARMRLQRQFPRLRGLSVYLTNDRYAVTSRQWVDENFAPYFAQLLFALNKRTWKRAGNQCEVFSMRALTALVDCFAAAMSNADNTHGYESVAAAWIAFKPDHQNKHAILIIYLDGEGWQGWEPQTQKFRPLTETETQSVDFAFLL